MANFKGFKQETLTNYNALTKEEKLNYLWLIRDVDKSGETEIVKSSAVYFGSRKYAEVNGSDEELVAKINAITSALGMVAGQDGAFEPYLPIDGDAILSGETITNVSEALKALSKAIVAAEAVAKEANTAAGEAKTAAEGAVSTANTAKDTADAAKTTAEAATGVANTAKETADAATGAANTATSTANKAKEAADAASNNVAALTKKIGTEAVGEEPATGIYAKIDAIEGKLDPNQEGSLAKDVENAKANIATIQGQIGDETSGILGDIAGLKTNSATKVEVDEKLKGYVTDTALTTKLADYATTATTDAIEKRVETVEGKVTDLESKSTITVTDYSKITGLTGCSVGQFVYANNNYTDPDNSGSTFAAGAYLITSVDTTGKPLTIAKIESTSQTEAAPVERIAALEGQVNGITAQIGEKGKDGNDGTGILGDIQKLQSSHDVTGNDVE